MTQTSGARRTSHSDPGPLVNRYAADVVARQLNPSPVRTDNAAAARVVAAASYRD